MDVKTTQPDCSSVTLRATNIPTHQAISGRVIYEEDANVLTHSTQTITCSIIFA